MGMDSRNEMEKSMLSAEVRQKFDELVALLAAEKSGPNGPPLDTRFAEIERFGHQTGRMLGRALDEHVTDQHAEHFQEASCPTCGATGEFDAAENTKTRLLQPPQDGRSPITVRAAEKQPAPRLPAC